jgi:serine/threonine protein kinase
VQFFGSSRPKVPEVAGKYDFTLDVPPRKSGEDAESAANSERFEREAKAIGALNHPNICTLYDVRPNYVVMDYVEGVPLKGPLPLDQTLKYAVQICAALGRIIRPDAKTAALELTWLGGNRFQLRALSAFGPETGRLFRPNDPNWATVLRTGSDRT